MVNRSVSRVIWKGAVQRAWIGRAAELTLTNAGEIKSQSKSPHFVYWYEWWFGRRLEDREVGASLKMLEDLLVPDVPAR